MFTLSLNHKFGNFTLSFGRLRQRIVIKCVPHVQHDYFSSFNQSDHCFLVSSLPLPSSLRKLPITNNVNLCFGVTSSLPWPLRKVPIFLLCSRYLGRDASVVWRPMRDEPINACEGEYWWGIWLNFWFLRLPECRGLKTKVENCNLQKA